MSNWKIIDKGEDLGSNIIMNLATLGTYNAFGLNEKIYEIENQETGETKFVIAPDSYEIGEMISEGDWQDEA